MLPIYQMGAIGFNRPTGGVIYTPSGTELALWDDPASFLMGDTLVNVAGAGPVGTLSGNLALARNLAVRCPTTGGALGVAQIQLSWDSGTTWQTAITANAFQEIVSGLWLYYPSGTSFTTAHVAYAGMSTWLDKSASANHCTTPATASARFGNALSPISTPGLRGSTNGQRLYCLGIRASAVAGGLNGSFSCAFAARRTGNGRQAVFGAGQTGTNYPMQFGFGGLSVGDRKLHVARRGSSDGATILAETGQVLPNNANLFAACIVVSGGTATFYLCPSTTAVATIALAAATGSYTTITSETLTGIGPQGQTQQFLGDLHALLVAPQTAFSSGDIAAVWDSMTARWGAF